MGHTGNPSENLERASERGTDAWTDRDRGRWGGQGQDPKRMQSSGVWAHRGEKNGGAKRPKTWILERVI